MTEKPTYWLAMVDSWAIGRFDTEEEVEAEWHRWEEALRTGDWSNVRVMHGDQDITQMLRETSEEYGRPCWYAEPVFED